MNHDFEGQFHKHYHGPDRGCGNCDDQLPVITTAGAGPQGDHVKIILHEDTNTITYNDTVLDASGSWIEVTKTEDVITTQYIETKAVNGRTGAETPIEKSDNINGGILYHTYNYRPFTVPATFTITFWYVRYDTHELTTTGQHSYLAWRWTTRPIPYVPDYEAGGDSTGPGHASVGSGVGALYIRANMNDPWMSKLIYPDGAGPLVDTTWNEGEALVPNQVNAPAPNADWTVNLTLGVGGDIDIPSLADIAKALGWNTQSIKDIILGPDNGSESYILQGSVKQYIDNADTMLDNKIEYSVKPVIQPAAEWADPGPALPGTNGGEEDGFGAGTVQTIYDKFQALMRYIQGISGYDTNAPNAPTTGTVDATAPTAVGNGTGNTVLNWIQYLTNRAKELTRRIVNLENRPAAQPATIMFDPVSGISRIDSTATESSYTIVNRNNMGGEWIIVTLDASGGISVWGKIYINGILIVNNPVAQSPGQIANIYTWGPFFYKTGTTIRAESAGSEGQRQQMVSYQTYTI